MVKSDNIPAKEENNGETDIWGRFERLSQLHTNEIDETSVTKRKYPSPQLNWIGTTILPLSLIILSVCLVWLQTSLPPKARLPLFVFSLAAILWSTTGLNAAYVALACVMLLVLTGNISQEKMYSALASDVIWLMIGAFVLGAAVQRTGLAARLTRLVVSRAKSMRGVFWLVTAMLLPLSFVIPSTSGRAAVMIPVFRSISASASDHKITRALALLIPSIILVATSSTLIGAGSHLIANDLLQQVANKNISFTRWAIWGVPFGLIACAITCEVILRLFLTPEQRQRTIDVTQTHSHPLSRSEWITISIVVTMVAFWLSESRHGLEIATVTVVGALFLTLPNFGVLSWKEGLKAISWNLIIFVGAALLLGRALIESGAAKWIIANVFSLSGLSGNDSPLFVLAVISFITLTSHIYMTSHAARAAALVPALLYLGNSLGLDPVAVTFIGTVGMDYCLTFPVSSKALMMFQELDGETYEPSDLLRLSAILLPIHLVLIVVFYHSYWRLTGLQL